MRVYISGPITGVNRDEALKAFARAEMCVRALADDPATVEYINPLKVGRVLEHYTKLTHAEYMKLSFALMDLCDAVYFMEGWEHSDGCCQEWRYAQNCHMKILRE